MKETYRILLVDDEPDVLSALKAALEGTKDLKAEVVTALGGEAGLERLAAAEFHLVISDYRMPGMTGVEFLRAVGERAPDAVRAMITAYNDLDIALEAVEKAQIHYYIQKPWSNEELRLTVAEALKGGWQSKV